MAGPMRRLLSLSCEGRALGASLDLADGSTGVLIVTGGTQTRIGSHRLFERLAQALSDAGYPCFRFDRRGIGDSDGEDPGFRGNGPDIAAAAAAFRANVPHLDRMIGLGLCDGATSLALFGGTAGLAGFILINPWLVEAEAGAPPAAAIKRHYRQQLLSLAGWKKIITGAVSYRKLLTGLRKISGPSPPPLLAAEVAEGLNAADKPAELILARDDATAVAAEACTRTAAFKRALGPVRLRTAYVESNAHTFSRPGDFEALLQACRASLARLAASGGG